MKPKRSLTALVLAAVLGLAACGSSSSSSSAKNTSGANASASTPFGTMAAATQVPSTIPITTALTKTPPTGLKVAFLSNGLQPAQLFAAALNTGAQAVGWTYQTFTYSPANPATADSAFLEAVNAGVNFIVVQALDPQIYAKLVPQATAKGIHVIDTLSSQTVTPGVTYVGRTDVASTGYAKLALTAVFADAQSRKVTPHILFAGSLLFGSTLTPIIADMTSDLKGANCGTCSLEVDNLSPVAVITAATVAPLISYIQSHPDVNYIFAPNGQLAIGLLAALKQDNLSGVHIIGLDPGPAQITELAAHTSGDIGWLPGDNDVLAWMCIDAAARLAVGDSAAGYASVPPPEWLLTSTSGGLVANPEAPADFQAQFKKNWGLS